MLHLFKKSTALLLVISMLLGVLCLPAFADVTQDKLDYLLSTTKPTDKNELVAGSAANLPEVPEPKDGYTHVLLGGGNESIYWSGFTYKQGNTAYNGYTDDKYHTVHNLDTGYNSFVTYLNRYGINCLNDGIYVTGLVDGEYVTEYVTIGNGITMNKNYIKNVKGDVKIPARFGQITQFVMGDTTTGQYATTYCADQVTNAQDGYYYNIANLENRTDYYTVEQAAMIRSVAWNGYWGDDSGLGMGSLADFKAMLTASKKFTDEEIASVTDGMAMAATQYAIWSFSNYQNTNLVQLYYSDAILHGKPELIDGKYVVTEQSKEAHKQVTDLVFRMYNHLINLDPTPVEHNTTGNTILNQSNVKDLRIFAKGLAYGHPNNLDASHDNDAYVCDLSFNMLVATDVQKDDLAVRVYDTDGNVLVVGRIAGELQEGEIQLVDDGTGHYTFHDIVFAEGTKIMNISLEGTQHLDRGVYLYTSEIKPNEDGEMTPSQTMVGVAEGTHKVNVDLSNEILFEIENVNDTVIIDYGRPVVVTPAQNTAFYGEGTLTAISANAQGYNDILFTEGLDETFSNKVEGKYGVFTLENGKIRYELNKAEHMLAMPTPDVAYYAVKTPNGYYYGKLTVIPATIIYYEDDFVSFTDTTLTEGTEGTGIWTTVGEQAPDIQSEDRIAISQNIYGHDPMNKNYTQYSNGMAHKVTVNSVTGSRGTDENGNFTAPTASFTFTGTGFDLISLTTTDTELIQVNVWNAETGKQVFRKVVNNYYGYNYGVLPAEDGGFVVDEEGNPVYGWYVDKDADGCVWQVPVMKVEGLEYGTYNVTILVAYMTAFDHNEDQKDSFVLDSIRVYDPAKYNDEAKDAYLADGEYNPTYKKLRDLILEASNFDGVDTEGELCLDGVVFVDGKSSTSLSMDYANPGPNNETYLAHGQSVAFKLAADIPVNNVHIGVKLAFGTSATLCLNGEELVTVTTATDMYYVLLDESAWHAVHYPNGTDGYETDVITLSCVSEDSVISMTNLKFTNFKNDNDATASINAFVDEEVLEDATAVVMALFQADAPEAEPETEAPTESETEAPTEPETEAPTEPETEAPTEPETEAPAAPETEAPAAPETEASTEVETDAPATEAPAENEEAKGCQSSVGMSLAVLMLAMAAAVALKKRN